MKARAAQTASASPHRVLMTTNSHIFPLFFILHAMFEWYYQSCQLGYLFFFLVWLSFYFDIKFEWYYQSRQFGYFCYTLLDLVFQSVGRF